MLELEEPVEDEQGYVYEKAAIIGHIRKSTRYPGGGVPCPMAGSYAGLLTCECVLRIQAVSVCSAYRRKGLGMLCNTAPSLGVPGFKSDMVGWIFQGAARLCKSL